MNKNNNNRGVRKNKLGLFSLFLGLLPIGFLTAAIIIGFAFSQSGLALGGILTYTFLGLMPFSNVIGLICALSGLIKKEAKSKVLISGLIINILFIVFYIIYLIDWMKYGF